MRTRKSNAAANRSKRFPIRCVQVINMTRTIPQTVSNVFPTA